MIVRAAVLQTAEVNQLQRFRYRVIQHKSIGEQLSGVWPLRSDEQTLQRCHGARGFIIEEDNPAARRSGRTAGFDPTTIHCRSAQCRTDRRSGSPAPAKVLSGSSKNILSHLSRYARSFGVSLNFKIRPIHRS